MSEWHHRQRHQDHQSVPVHRAPRAEFRPRSIYLAFGVVAAIVAIVCVVIWQEKPASSAADAAAVESTARPIALPTTRPGTPVPQRKPVEVSPPAASAVPGDGTWLVGREIKRGTYKSAGGSTCYWARLSDLSGELEAIIANSYGRRGPQKVALGPKDKAFASQGCGAWELIS